MSRLTLSSDGKQSLVFKEGNKKTVYERISRKKFKELRSLIKFNGSLQIEAVCKDESRSSDYNYFIVVLKIMHETSFYYTDYFTIKNKKRCKKKK